jgi:hypothetical protein
LYFGFVSGFSAYLSLLIWQWYFQINNSLDSITSRLAIYLVLIFALISSLIRCIYLIFMDPQIPFFTVFTIGLIGDIVGCFIVLYLIKGGLYLYRQFSKY